MNRSVVLTSRGIGFLVAAVVCFVAAPILSLPALLYVTVLLVGLVVFSTIFVFGGHSNVRIERSFSPQVVGPGLTAKATVRVTNLSMIPCLEAQWADVLPSGISGDASGTLPALGGSRQSDSRVSFSYALQGLRRGRHPIGPLKVQVLDPFGLVYRKHSFGAEEPLIVLPRRIDLLALAPRGESDDGATRPAPQHVGVGDDDVIARAYLPGDAMKRLHWKATAHRGQLMVRQEEQQINPRAGVFLDCEPRSQGTARDGKGVWEHSPTFEWGIVAAASIVHHLARNGYVVSFQTSSPAIDREISDGQDSVEDAMVDLAVLEPDETEHNRYMAPERAAFAILGRLDIPRAEHWIHAVGGARDVHAFVASGTSAAALDVLDGARWKVVTYRPNDDLAAMWMLFDAARARA
ncbi:hypothetical protein GCM10022234_01420 [Aeromicrobium panaciterrae]|uniref:DUF58 domain-containing protein n=1 Tax=Aeromicrobium panaciterrae TaxID=363861 RepID=UPI0031E3D050